MHPPLHIITGTTASGKTTAALSWAEKNNAEIISCDSLLFYRGMDIGTAKPSRKERARVRHHLIDISDVSQALNVKAYVDLALAAVHDIQARGKQVVVVGGSGFYLKSFFAPVHDELEINPAIRAHVREIENKEGLNGMQKHLNALNPQGLSDLDVNNPRRVSRALERCMLSGSSLNELSKQFKKLPCPFADWPKQIELLQHEPNELNKRIAKRTQEMINNGLVDEVKALLKQGLQQNSSAANAIGYRETIQYLKGGQSLDELAELINLHTRQLAAKHRKWLRRLK